MRRFSPLVAAAAALALCAAAPSLAAQSASGSADSAAVDSTAHRLAPVEVRADKEQRSALGRLWRNLGARAEITALERENRMIARRLQEYDRQIVRLEHYRDSLRATVELREHRVAMLDSAAAATRAQRIRLEERVRMLEGRTAVATELIP